MERCAFSMLEIIYTCPFFFVVCVLQNFPSPCFVSPSPYDRTSRLIINSLVIRMPCSLDTNKFLTFLRAFILLFSSSPCTCTAMRSRYKLTFVPKHKQLLPIFFVLFLVGCVSVQCASTPQILVRTREKLVYILLLLQLFTYARCIMFLRNCIHVTALYI